jgi:hypothetical protein
MSAHDNLESASGWIYVQVFENVQHVDTDGTDLNDFRQRQRLSPDSRIDVSPHRYHGSQGFQSLKNPRRAHVSGVEDQVRTAQSAHGPFPQQSVRVRNQSEDFSLFSQFSSQRQKAWAYGSNSWVKYSKAGAASLKPA